MCGTSYIIQISLKGKHIATTFDKILGANDSRRLHSQNVVIPVLLKKNIINPTVSADPVRLNDNRN
jgi:hypothetical protein